MGAGTPIESHGAQGEVTGEGKSMRDIALDLRSVSFCVLSYSMYLLSSKTSPA